MATPLIPWEPHVFPAEIQAELRRRSTNRGMSPVVSDKVSWTGDDDGWNDYRGPMTAWTRVCSNGYGPEQNKMPGFVFYGGKGFSTTYGFHDGLRTGNPNLSILGHMPNGRPHFLENDINSDYPIHVPSPEIEKISATIQKELLRRVRIEWTCFSFKQLEYMTPYFLIPGISVIVEWGWNHFNPESLLDLNNPGQLADYYNNPYPLYSENVLNSRGNYEVVFGIVTNFEWSIDGNKIKCVTEVTSKDRLWAGQQVGGNTLESDPSVSDDKNTNADGKPVNDVKSETNVLDSLKKFVDQYIDKFKDVIDLKKSGDEIVNSYTNQVQEDKRPLYNFISYLKEKHPNNYKEYLFGLYYGRDEGENVGSMAFPNRAPKGANKDHDFDCNPPRQHLWLNMGLVVELINFFSSQLKGVKNKPLFQINVDDCVISGHPNLISTNGNVLLIPNAFAPKYGTGYYGYITAKKDLEYWPKAKPATSVTPKITVTQLDPQKTTPDRKHADYRLHRMLMPIYNTYRDNLSTIINFNREHFAGPEGFYEFPFATVPDGLNYEREFTGYFKNLYLNANVLKTILKDEKVRFYSDVMNQIFSAINSAASGFWKFELVAGTGNSKLKKGEAAAMKIIDGNLAQRTSNSGQVFTFDYNAADGLLQSLNFRPTLSNAQAIRTIYAQTNLTNKQSVVISGHNELLDYKFRDRLFMEGDQSANQENVKTVRESSFKTSMGILQSIRPPKDAFQVTMDYKGQNIIFRLAIPPANEELLSLLLDDNDKGHNPRYTGIMPGIQAEFTLQGIAGIRTFAMFRVRGLPEPYSEKNIVFRVINCTDTIQNGQWVTQITAGVLPLRGYFASKLGLSSSNDVAPT